MQVLAVKGSKVVCVPEKTAAVHVSYAATASATGEFIAPYMIIAGKNTREHHAEGWPDAYYQYTTSGGMESETFLDWSRVFVRASGAALERPKLLLLDNHSSHLDILGTMHLYANGVRILYLPPHTTHILCPLDVSFFRPFKAALSNAARELYRGVQALKVEHIITCARHAYIATSTISRTPGTDILQSSVISGFRAAGIHPYNPAATAPNIVAENAPAAAVDAVREPVEVPDLRPEAIAARLAELQAAFPLALEAYTKRVHGGGRSAMFGEEMLAARFAKEQAKAESDARPKRPRGRPRKKDKVVVPGFDGEEPQPEYDIPDEDSAAEEPLPVIKKKRGRPPKKRGEPAEAPQPPAKKRRRD